MHPAIALQKSFLAFLSDNTLPRLTLNTLSLARVGLRSIPAVADAVLAETTTLVPEVSQHLRHTDSLAYSRR